jgi:hypothetical protein
MSRKGIDFSYWTLAYKSAMTAHISWKMMTACLIIRSTTTNRKERLGSSAALGFNQGYRWSGGPMKTVRKRSAKSVILLSLHPPTYLTRCPYHIACVNYQDAFRGTSILRDMRFICSFSQYTMGKDHHFQRNGLNHWSKIIVITGISRWTIYGIWYYKSLQ